MTPRQRLDYLEEMMRFLAKAMPDRSKKIWERLKKMGW